MHLAARPWPRSLLSLCAFSLVLIGGSASAAPYETPFPTEDKRLQGNGSAVDNVGSKGTPRALLNVRIDYAQGWDTDVRDIGFDFVDNWLFRPWLGDDDAKSPFTAQATWRDVSKSQSVEYQHLTAHCRQKVCDVGAVVRTDGKIPLLAGFSFHNLSGAKQIERMAVYPKSKNGWVSYEARYEAPGRTNYVVDVFVVLVDRQIVDAAYSAEANSRDGEHFARVPLQWKKTGLLALQGFDVKFRNGSHQLQEFAIEALPGTNAAMGVYFSDDNDDDPMWGKLWWVDLRAPGIQVIPMDEPLPQQRTKPIGPTPQLDPSVNPSVKPTNKGGTKPTSPKGGKKLPAGLPKFPK